MKRVKKWNNRNTGGGWPICGLAEALYDLNEALRNGYRVFAVCEKEPKNLDSGNHYFQIYMVTENHSLTIFWFPPIMDVSKGRANRRYSFQSGAIGMSRVWDATDYPFSLLKEMGGYYTQIDCIN